MKQIFFKTVRNDYTSVWAIGKHCRKYKVGTHHKFNPNLPAHAFGFGVNGYISPYGPSDIFPEQSVENPDYIYGNRAESVGTRVMICYGEVRPKQVPVCEVKENWDFNSAPRKWRWGSDDFVVLGELKPKRRDRSGDDTSTFVKLRANNKFTILGGRYASI